MRNQMSVVAKIEIMEDRMIKAKLMGHQDVADYYKQEIRQLQKIERDGVVRA